LKKECQYLTNERDRQPRDVSDFRIALFAQRRLSNELCYPLLKAHFRKKQKKKILKEVKNQLKQISTQQIRLHEATGVLQLMSEQAQKASIERANLLKKNSHWRNMTVIIYELWLLKIETQRY
jgi:hypothetical protein